MIKVARHSVPAPEGFLKRAAKARRELAAFVKTAHKDAQRKLPFNDRLLHSDDLREALTALFRRRCAFCESPLTSGKAYKNVGHFRPNHRAAQLDGKVDPLHYWWLAYEWSNLYAICTTCLSTKGSRFPVKGRRAEPGGSLDLEKALLLDPCRDDPEAELQFLEDGTVRSDTERGQITIDVLGLNRLSLVHQRRERCELVDSVGDVFLSDNEP